MKDKLPWKPFAVVFMGLVVLPHLLLLSVVLEGRILGSNHLAALLFLPLSVYYFLPASLLGESHHTVGIGAGPSDLLGVLLTITLYTCVCFVLAFLFDWVKRGTRRSS